MTEANGAVVGPTQKEDHYSADAVLARCLGSLNEGSAGSEIENALACLTEAGTHQSEVQRELVRIRAADRLKRLKLGKARLVDAALRGSGAAEGKKSSGQAVVPPWPEPVDGCAVAQELLGLFEKHLVLPEGGQVAATLFAFYTYVSDVSYVSPSLGVISAVKRSGKTTMMSILAETVRDPLPTSNATPAAIFRAIEKWRPTLLLDEAETFITNEKNELRGILNSGHTRQTAYCLRCVGDDHEPQQFSTFCPKVFALIGRLPSTLEDRTIAIPMRRRLTHETVERWEPDALRDDLVALRRKLVRWANDNKEKVRLARPEGISGLHDRAADNWRPMLAIASVIGGDWEAQARHAALALAAAQPQDSADNEIMLLADLRAIFESHGERLGSHAICGELGRLEDRPWPEWKVGKPITPPQLAQMLKSFGIKPKIFRFGTGTQRGYELEQFRDAFARHLPAQPKTGDTHVTDDTTMTH